LVLGSHDTRVAERGAELFLQGWAPWLIFSGGRGSITQKLWDRSEAEVFADIALGMGVPAKRILKEERSTNTGENIRFTRELLKGEGRSFKSVLLVQKPYMERRAYATFRKQWPGCKVTVTSPGLSYDTYPTKSISKDQLINIMVGDLQRIRLYPERGFQIEQTIPREVWDAYSQLVERGYSQRIIDSM
jgi:uncharacterized SAM-binding protein YcdF (DUF218 family)